MPRGVYKTKVAGTVKHGQVWPDAVIDVVRVELAKGEPYSNVLKVIRARFPNFHTTRNALIGKAARLGLRSSHKMRNHESIVEVKAQRKRDLRVKPKKEKPVELLRNEGDSARGPVEPYRKRTKEEIADARKGHIPSIVERSPATSKPFGELKRGECKWPTALDASMACGGAATVGSYCDKHAILAYRVMPTRKRNASIGKEQDIDRARRLLNAEADMTIEHFLGVGIKSPKLTGVDHVDTFIEEEILNDD